MDGIRPEQFKAQYTPPTPTRLNSAVASRRVGVGGCVLGISDCSRLFVRCMNSWRIVTSVKLHAPFEMTLHTYLHTYNKFITPVILFLRFTWTPHSLQGGFRLLYTLSLSRIHFIQGRSWPGVSRPALYALAG